MQDDVIFYCLPTEKGANAHAYTDAARRGHIPAFKRQFAF
jgi:hypothetical protein